MIEYCPVSGETPQEERLNFLTHLAGFLLSLVGVLLLLLQSPPEHLLSCSVYGSAMILLYGASTIYHASTALHHKKKLRILDHSCIYLMIAGCYTPYTLGPLYNYGGSQLLTIVWCIALAGVVFKIFAVDKFPVISLISYLAMSWMIALNMPTLINEISLSALLWMIAGGLAYTVGTVFYAWASLPFNHCIWHIFVLTGSFCHYCSILEVIAL